MPDLRVPYERSPAASGPARSPQCLWGIYTNVSGVKDVLITCGGTNGDVSGCNRHTLGRDAPVTSAFAQPQTESDRRSDPCLGLVHPSGDPLSLDSGLFNLLAEHLPAHRAMAVLQMTYVNAQQEGFETCIDQLDDAIDWCRSKGHERVHLLGLSMGGAVVLRAAARRSNIVSSACTLCSQPKGVKYDALESLCSGDHRILVVHGLADSNVPHWAADMIASSICGLLMKNPNPANQAAIWAEFAELPSAEARKKYQTAIQGGYRPACKVEFRGRTYHLPCSLFEVSTSRPLQTGTACIADSGCRQATTSADAIVWELGLGARLVKMVGAGHYFDETAEAIASLCRSFFLEAARMSDVQALPTPADSQSAEGALANQGAHGDTDADSVHKNHMPSAVYLTPHGLKEMHNISLARCKALLRAHFVQVGVEALRPLGKAVPLLTADEATDEDAKDGRVQVVKWLMDHGCTASEALCAMELRRVEIERADADESA